MEMVVKLERGSLRGALLLAFLVLFQIPLLAQSMEDQFERYDLNTEITFTGELMNINLPPHGMVTLGLKRGEKLYILYVAPVWFYRELNPNIKIGDQLEIRGAKLYIPRYGPVFVVRSIRNFRTEEEIIFRTSNFKPLWKMRRGRFNP
ncbi:MAG: hypothetical protein RMI63_07580 [Caldimicrobium sp.]|nr:hypothetical protein [Caldimicrobium sp.]